MEGEGEVTLFADPKAALADSLRRDGSMTESEIEKLLCEIGQVQAGTATAEGEDRAVLAARAATLPLLTDGSIRGAGLIVDIAGGDDDLTEEEVRTVVEMIHLAATPQAEINFGTVIDGTLAGKIRVSVFVLADE